MANENDTQPKQLDCFRNMQPGEIVAFTFQIFQQHLIVLVMVTLVPELLLLGAELLLHEVLMEPPVGLPLLLGMTVIANGVALSAIATVVAGAVLGGAPTIGQTYQLVFRNRVWAVLIGYFITALATSAGLMMFVFPGLILGGALALTVPVVVIEGRSAFQGIQRSTLLVRGEMGKAVTVFAFVVLVSGMLPLLFQLTIGIGTLTPVLGALLTSVTMPLGYSASIILYFSLRSAKENYTAAMLESDLNQRLGQ